MNRAAVEPGIRGRARGAASAPGTPRDGWRSGLARVAGTTLVVWFFSDDLRALGPDELHDRLVSANAVARCYQPPVPRGEDMRSWLVMVDEVVRGTA